MPKTKKVVTKGEETEETTPILGGEKEILLPDEEKEGVDPELIAGDVVSEDEEEEVALADDDEVDPFKDRWEE